jgi:DNA-binding NarL/FixJ family response regulator
MTILLADDHPLFRAGVKQVLEKSTSCRVVGEAENGSEALQKIISLKPDIAILDVRMPEKSGLEVLEYINENNLPVKVILLTMYKNPNYLYKAIPLGVKGYLSKEDTVLEIIKAVETIFNGRSYISSSLSVLLIGKEKSEKELQNNIKAVSSLTRMEKEVMKLIAEWKSNNEIAEKLFISARTAGNHRTNISNKLNLRGSHSLIKFAIENKELF